MRCHGRACPPPYLAPRRRICSAPLLLDAFAAFFRDPVEVTGAVLSASSIFLLMRQNVWGWPIGIVATSLYIPVYYRAELYADMGLYALIFLPGLIYGWVVWGRGGADGGLFPVQRAPAHYLTLLLCGAGVVTVALGYSLDRWTGQSLAYWDSYTTAFAIAGQLMQARKWIENWLLWIIVDAVAAGVYLVKGLYPTMVLYVLFLALAVKGYAEWKRDLAPVPAST